MAAQIGHPDFLIVGDCKLSSLENRGQIQREGGYYLCPLPRTGRWPHILQDWVSQPPVDVHPVYLTDGDSQPIGKGFTMELGKIWCDPVTDQRVTWTEQVFVFQSRVLAHREIETLHRRIERAQEALHRLAQRPGTDGDKLVQKAEALLQKYKVAGLLAVAVEEHRWTEERLVGPGRPGPNRAKRLVEYHKLSLKVERCPEAIAQAQGQAGWRLYACNAGPDRLTLGQAIAHYREQWQPERGFHRFKRGKLTALPLYLQDDARIRGLMLLLSIALRVFTLMEFVVRRKLQRQQEKLQGLYEGNPRRATDRPTAEKLLAAFQPITLYRHSWEDGVEEKISPLSPLQMRTLELMEVPKVVYAALESGPSG